MKSDMNPEMRERNIRDALKVADWYSTEITVDYNSDMALGVLFADGRIVFYDSTVLEFTESVTPERIRYRYHYMKADGTLIFRYDNVPHHRDIRTFPDHKHCPGRVVESQFPD
ncbi:MAG: hypothetical protein DRI57_11875 [Deltaproteobacteria bacterium]|nr:MAG: hypothetical protein DRI57_11875 [Deltaproteobacteria bacterium]